MTNEDNTDEVFRRLTDNTDKPASEREKMKSAIIAGVLAVSECWPDILAAWNGMLKQAMDDGWEEMPARGMVLSACISDPLYLACNVKPDADAA